MAAGNSEPSVSRKPAGRMAPCIEPHPEDVIEDRLADVPVDLGTGHVDKIGTQHFEDEIEDEDDRQADRQSNKRIRRIVPHHPIIDRQGEERRYEREGVD